MKKFEPLLAAAMVMLACSLPSGLPAGSSTPTLIASPQAATETQVPPTPVPPSPTPLPPLINANNVAGLAKFMSFADGELVRSLAFSPDGTALAAAVGDEAGTIRLFEVAYGLPLRTLDGHESIVWGLAFSPDGRFLASAGRDFTAKIWDWQSGTLVQSLAFPNEVTAVAFSPDSQTLAVGGVDELPGTALQDATIWAYAVDSWQPGLEFAEFWNIPDIDFSPDGGLVVGGGISRNVRVWRAGDGVLRFVLYHAGQVSSIAISPDGSTVATGSCQQSANNQCTIGAIWLWDLTSGHLLEKLADFPEGVVDVEFSHDGSAVIGGSRDGTLRAYRMSDYELLLATTSSVGGSPAAIIAMAISSDGRFLATAGNGRINMWRVGP
jgi:WD40 repeat protein